MLGYFAVVTRQGDTYQVDFPDLEIDRFASDTVEAALHRARRTIQNAANDPLGAIPAPRPSFELIDEAGERDAVAAVCIAIAA